MNTALAWENVVAYSLQIGLLVGLASLIPALLRLRLPKARLAYWHLLLAACLVLPQTRPWKQAIITVTTPAAVVTPVAPVVAVRMPRTQTHWAPGEIGLLLPALGAVARPGGDARPAAGLPHLRGHRQSGNVRVAVSRGAAAAELRAVASGHAGGGVVSRNAARGAP